MEPKVRLLGHPVHPMLIVFPLGLLATAMIFDVLYVVTANEDLATFSFWALVAGLIGGLLAAIFGLIDWLGLPEDTRARRIGAMHGAGNLVVVVVFLLSLVTRLGDHAYLPDVLPAVLSIIGSAIAVVTAWLGGELVYRLRVAVDDDAGLDASNSLEREGPVEAKV